jgi:hypothetical protein
VGLILTFALLSLSNGFDRLVRVSQHSKDGAVLLLLLLAPNPVSILACHSAMKCLSAPLQSQIRRWDKIFKYGRYASPTYMVQGTNIILHLNRHKLSYSAAIQACSITSVIVILSSTSRSNIFRIRSMHASENGIKGTRSGWSRISSIL